MNNISHSRYVITEQKEAELQQLKMNVISAQYLVNELQAHVSSLQLKSTEFTNFLNAAQIDEQTALTNLDLVKSVVSTVTALNYNVELVKNQTQISNEKVQSTAKNMATMIDQLIFSVDIVDKLSKLINKKKALNPLISDELVVIVTTATQDANVAISASLTALKSCFAALVTTEESQLITSLGAKQGADLLHVLTGTPINVANREFYAIEANNVLNHISLCVNAVKKAEQKVSIALDSGIAIGIPISKGVDNVEDEIANLEEDIAITLVKVEEAALALGKATSELPKTKKASDVAEKALDELRVKVVDLKEYISNSKNNLDRLSEKEAKLTNQIGSLANEVKSASGAEKVALQAELKALQIELKAVQSELKFFQAELSKSQIELDAKQIELKALEVDSKAANKALGRATNKFENDQASFDQLTAALKALEEKLNLVRLGSEVDVKTAETAYNKAVDSLSGKLQRLSNTEAEVLNINQQLSFEEEGASDYKSLVKKKEAAKKFIKDLPESINQDQQNVYGAKQVLETAKAVLSAAESELDNAVKALDRTMSRLNQTAQSQQKNTLFVILAKAYVQAQKKYTLAKKTNDDVTKELNSAQYKLTIGINRLSSLKAGLIAAQAAAMAA